MAITDDGITLPGTDPYNISGSDLTPAQEVSSGATSISTPSFMQNPSVWWEQNVTSPALNAIGLPNLLGGGSISNALNAAGLTSSSSSGSNAELSDLFLRGIVVILGLVFVAFGLNMFASKGTIAISNELQRSYGKKP